jgi:uncharacterized membrane protein
MSARLLHVWSYLGSSLWFIPTVMAAAAIAIALVMLQLDELLEPEPTTGWIYSRSASGARSLLSTVATSMITVAGMAFSVYVVALQLASSQFGPRVLRTFMRDRGTQVVLGTFISTFLYCLMVMRTISDEGGDGEPAPSLAVTGGLALAVASLGVLIYFLHHAAQSMHAPNVISTAARELTEAIDRLYPDAIGRDSGEVTPQPPQLSEPAVLIPVDRSGYLQHVDGDGLLQGATEGDVVIWIQPRPGDFIAEGQPLAFAYPADRVTQRVIDTVRALCIVGGQRTEEQDIEYTAEQLVQIAVRSLSPSINDPFTAMGAIDHLAGALVRLIQREAPSAVRMDGEGRPRVIASAATVERVIDGAYRAIRQASRDSALVTRKLMETLEWLSAAATLPDTLATIRTHAALVAQNGEGLASGADRQMVRELYARVLAALDGGAPAMPSESPLLSPRRLS